ncbi:MAG: GreA/GreB family elongation factor [Bacilli bacterium]|nr:GreA/GreB family elongation factor [Bacilli bacterium]
MNNIVNQKEEIVNIGDFVIIDITELKSKITTRNCFELVENYKYNPKEKINKIDVISPLGKRVLFGKVGDNGDYKVHEYNYHYEINEIIKMDNEKEKTISNNSKTKTLKK